MSKKILLVIFITHIIATGAGFYAGMKYGQRTCQKLGGQGFIQEDFQNFQNLSPEERQQRIQQMGVPGTGSFNEKFGNRAGSGFVTGEIISKDDQSITVKLQDGGSKIVFYSGTTEVGKFTDGAPSDLEVGKTVSVNGKANQDGSITAQSIQLRPDIANP